MPDIDKLSMLLGEMKNGIETISKAQSEDRIASAQYRTDIRAELGKLGTQISDVKVEVRQTKDKVALLEPDIADYRKNRERITGAVTWSRAVWFGVVAIGGGVIAVSTLLYNLAYWLLHLPHTPPPPP